MKAIAPPNSYIHAEDFASPKALVDYLDYLHNNDTAYLEYHLWRRMEVKPRKNKKLGLTAQMTCDLCKEIKRRKAANWAKKTIKSVASWWWLNIHDANCTGILPIIRED